MRFAGEDLGRAPFSGPVRVNAGRGLLQVTAPGYQPFTRLLELAGGARRRIEVELVREEQVAALQVTCPVAGARIEIDGRVRGQTPLDARLEPGRHVLVVSHPGYEPVRTELVLGPRERRSVEVPLAPRQSLLLRWWFWAAVGAVVAGAAVTTVALTSERSPREGDIAPGLVSAPLSGRR